MFNSYYDKNGWNALWCCSVLFSDSLLMSLTLWVATDKHDKWNLVMSRHLSDVLFSCWGEALVFPLIDMVISQKDETDIW